MLSQSQKESLQAVLNGSVTALDQEAPLEVGDSPSYKSQTQRMPGLRFSITLGEVPEVELNLVYYYALVSCTPSSWQIGFRKFARGVFYGVHLTRAAR